MALWLPGWRCLPSSQLQARLEQAWVYQYLSFWLCHEMLRSAKRFYPTGVHPFRISLQVIVFFRFIWRPRKKGPTPQIRDSEVGSQGTAVISRVISQILQELKMVDEGSQLKYCRVEFTHIFAAERQCNTVFHPAGHHPASSQQHIPEGWRLLCLLTCSCVNSSISTESGTEYEGRDSRGRRTSTSEGGVLTSMNIMLILFKY